MARIAIPTLDIIYREVFVLQPLYRATRHWLMENEFVDPKGDGSMESAMEVLYHYRKGTTISPAEKELRIWWRTVKSSPVNLYVHHLDIDWNIIQMYDLEIMREGKKEKVQKGEMRIGIRAYIDVPDLKSSPILKFFDNWYKTRLIKKNLEESKKMLYQDAYRLQGMMKKYLDMKTFIPEEEKFHEKFEFI